MYTTDAAGQRVYTLKKVQGSEVTKSAHPARFSPDDKYSRCVAMAGMRVDADASIDRHRVTLKKRYGLLITQQSLFLAHGLDLLTSSEDLRVLGQ